MIDIAKRYKTAGLHYLMVSAGFYWEKNHDQITTTSKTRRPQHITPAAPGVVNHHGGILDSGVDTGRH